MCKAELVTFAIATLHAKTSPIHRNKEERENAKTRTSVAVAPIAIPLNSTIKCRRSVQARKYLIVFFNSKAFSGSVIEFVYNLLKVILSDGREIPPIVISTPDFY